MCWVRHRTPVLTLSWWGPYQWVNPFQPSVRSAVQSFFSLLCCCSSRGCNMGLLWFRSLSWWFILIYWVTSLMNGTFRSSCRVWLVTYHGAFVIIRSILDWLRCILAVCDLLVQNPQLKLNVSVDLSAAVAYVGDRIVPESPGRQTYNTRTITHFPHFNREIGGSIYIRHIPT
jgi:hypothetical protein